MNWLPVCSQLRHGFFLSARNPGVSEPHHLFAQGLRKLRPRPLTDSTFFVRSTPFHFISQAAFPFHCVPTAANCRDRQKTSGAPEIQAAMLRISAQMSNSRATSSGQEIGITARGSACRRGHGNNREIGHFRTASISQAALQRTETAELTDGGPTARWLV
jgi:hypothetical protein